jgi:hypothetical protein
MFLKRAWPVFPRRASPSAILTGMETAARLIKHVRPDRIVVVINPDKPYLTVSTALDNLPEAVGLVAAQE